MTHKNITHIPHISFDNMYFLKANRQNLALPTDIFEILFCPWKHFELSIDANNMTEDFFSIFLSTLSHVIYHNKRQGTHFCLVENNTCVLISYSESLSLR